MIRKGDVCIFDPKNKLNLSGKTMLFVKVVDIHGIWPFRMADCLMCDPDGTIVNESLFNSRLNLLVPPGRTNPTYILRYHEDTPIITKQDVDLIVDVSNKIENQLDLATKNKLGLLIVKLNFFAKIINEF